MQFLRTIDRLNTRLKNNPIKRWEDRIFPKYENHAIVVGNILVFGGCGYFLIKIGILVWSVL